MAKKDAACRDTSIMCKTGNMYTLVTARLRLVTGYSVIPKPEWSLVLFRNGYMPRIPRGDQIVPLQTVPSRLQLLLHNVHLAIYLSIFPSALFSNSKGRTLQSIWHIYSPFFAFNKHMWQEHLAEDNLPGPSHLAARYITLQLAIESGIMSPKHTKVR